MTEILRNVEQEKTSEENPKWRKKTPIEKSEFAKKGAAKALKIFKQISEPKVDDDVIVTKIVKKTVKKPISKPKVVSDDVIVTKIVKKPVDQKLDNLLPWNAYDDSDDEDVIVKNSQTEIKEKKLTFKEIEEKYPRQPKSFKFKDLPDQIQKMIKQKARNLKLEDIRKNKSKTKIFKFKESIGTANDDEERIDIISVKVGLDKSGSKKEVHKCHRALETSKSG